MKNKLVTFMCSLQLSKLEITPFIVVHTARTNVRSEVSAARCENGPQMVRFGQQLCVS